jgi:hypothetical protein
VRQARLQNITPEVRLRILHNEDKDLLDGKDGRGTMSDAELN